MLDVCRYVCLSVRTLRMYEGMYVCMYESLTLKVVDQIFYVDRP